ncbi:VirK family protein [Xanthomonas campestris pv. raphani]|uniref:VirK family protein n=1 Tax=Xanthomonas campestris TaxID=339 RepID=UPI000E32A89C|nr:VirK family protein [Xanthomonas campestris]MCC8487692.1 VirK family protein [Xanthomonas campestris]MEA9650036.1 VirK family protein [Xanthomonas campestris pv. raphani]MEA9739709.1 VirK family protein [Xanthomonas campestris pv. raphani]MEA9743303.1 VirK family protein [Xanthomonas campestris pv. raphani]MEA9766911.1 VirK family protein [Xanthomonas campestris pv. raphani]
MFRSASIAVTAALCACALPALASETLNSRTDVLAALEAGYDVSVSTDLSRCTPEEGTPVSRTRGGRHIDAYRITDDGNVAFSGAHFTVANDGKPIQQFMRYQLRPDGSVRFTTYMYDLPGLQQRGPVLAYQCAFNEGARFHAD